MKNSGFEALDGTAGIVYLMFLGRETYVAQIQEPLTASRIYKNKENVNQTFYRLTKEEGKLLKLIRTEKGKVGTPNLYTSNFEPVFTTLKKAGIEFDEKDLTKTLTDLSFLNDSFPKYLINILNHGSSKLYSKLYWKLTLANYFRFLFTMLEQFMKLKCSKEEEKQIEDMHKILVEELSHPKLNAKENEKLITFIEGLGSDVSNRLIVNFLLWYGKLLFGSAMLNKIISISEKLSSL